MYSHFAEFAHADVEQSVLPLVLAAASPKQSLRTNLVSFKLIPSRKALVFF